MWSHILCNIIWGNNMKAASTPRWKGIGKSNVSSATHSSLQHTLPTSKQSKKIAYSGLSGCTKHINIISLFVCQMLFNHHLIFGNDAETVDFCAGFFLHGNTTIGILCLLFWDTLSSNCLSCETNLDVFRIRITIATDVWRTVTHIVSKLYNMLWFVSGGDWYFSAILVPVTEICIFTKITNIHFASKQRNDVNPTVENVLHLSTVLCDATVTSN